MLARGGFIDTANQAHAYGTVSANGLKPGKRDRIGVDIALQLSAGVADISRVDENGRNASIDHGRLQGTNAGHLQVIQQISGGEHRAACALFIRRRVKKLKLHLCGREGHPVQFKITGFLYLAIADGHMGNDGLADIGLPDTHSGDAVLRHSAGVEQAAGDGKRAHGR